jgi:hypothetical protein
MLSKRGVGVGKAGKRGVWCLGWWGSTPATLLVKARYLGVYQGSGPPLPPGCRTKEGSRCG